MAKGERPKFQIVAKNKETGERVQVAGCWEGKYGFNVGMKDLKIRLKDGTTITADTHFVNLYENKPKDEEEDDAPPASDSDDKW